MISWLYNHYILTAAVSLYYMVLIGYGTYQMFTDVSAITSGAATAYVALMGLPAAAGAIIKWRMEKDDDRTES